MYKDKIIISHDKPSPIERDEKYVYVNEDIKEYLDRKPPSYKYTQKKFTKEEFDEVKVKWGDIYHAKCEICGEVYDRYHILHKIKYLDGTTKVVCRDCQEKELKDKSYFRNYIPNFMDGVAVSIIFNNDKEVIDHIKSIIKDDEIAAISAEGYTVFSVFDNEDTNDKSWLCIGTTNLSEDCGLAQLRSFY